MYQYDNILRQKNIIIYIDVFMTRSYLH